MKRQVRFILLSILCMALLAGCIAALTGCIAPGDMVQPIPAIQSNSPTLQTAASPTPLPDHSMPEGNNQFMRYGRYIYYIPWPEMFHGSPLCRMQEDGSNPETLLPEESVSGFLMAGGKLFVQGTVFTDSNKSTYEYALHRIDRGGSITEVKRFAGGRLSMLDGGVYFAPLDPSEDMALAEEKARDWENISGSGQGYTAKGPGGSIQKTGGYLYYLYSVADVPGRKYHQVLVKVLPDGTEEKTLDKGQLTGRLYRSGDTLVYGKGDKFPSQIWGYDTKTGKKKLLFDMASINNAPDILSIEGVKNGWVYFKYRYKNSGDSLYRVKADDAKTVETVWDWNTSKGELWDTDLENGWIYYGIFVRTAEEEQYMNSNDYHYILRSHRCRLDGSEDIRFCERSAREPVTIGDWIYFSAADREIKLITVKRYNTVTKVLEEMPDGLVRDLTKQERL